MSTAGRGLFLLRPAGFVLQHARWRRRRSRRHRAARGRYEDTRTVRGNLAYGRYEDTHEP
eukprot:1177250-Prymnesium_polylepis.1